MPNDVKAGVSTAVAIIALILIYWNHSPVRPEFGNFVLVTAAFMIVAMWIFPEAGGKKRVPKDDKGTRAGSKF
jgi:membrane protein YdbS with pleckstrin-like domain